MIVAASAASFCPGAVAAAKPSGEHLPWKVLVVQGHDPQLPATVIQDQAMRLVLNAAAPRIVDVYAETFDSTRFRSQEFEELLLAMLRRKYADTHFDALIDVGH